LKQKLHLPSLVFNHSQRGLESPLGGSKYENIISIRYAVDAMFSQLVTDVGRYLS